MAGRRIVSMKRLGKYVAVGAILLFATGPVFAARVAEENVVGISLRLERMFTAPRDKVFGLWTDPKAVAQWFLPPGQARWTEPPTFDVRPGGRFSLRLISREESYDLHGTFREVRSPEKLVLNWQWDKDSPLGGSPGDTEVSIEFLARGARTDVVLTQFGFGNEESRGQYERGWNRCFREMDKLLAAVPGEIDARSKEFIRVSSPIVALEHATVIDGTGAPARQDQTIVIASGRIAALGPSGTVDIPANAERVNLAGYTALPGLVGMHDHLFYARNFFHTDDLLAHVMPFSYPRLYLANGVTTIRTTASFEPYADLEIKRKVDAGTLIGPKIHVTSPCIEGEGYPLTQLHVLTGPEDARRMVEYWAREGATSFKLYTDVTRAEAKAAIDEAHRWGLTITGHLCSIGFREAAELGIDNVEHGLWVDTEFASDKQPDVCPPDNDASAVDLDVHGDAIRSLIKTLVDHHVAVTSTMAGWERFVPCRPEAIQRVLDVLSESDRKFYKAGLLLDRKKMTDGTSREKELCERLTRMLKKEMEFERAFVRAGGLLLAGSDGVFEAVIAGFADQRELEMLVEAGFTPEQAIQIASLNGAQFLKEASRIGSLEVGKQADIMIVKGQPAKNIRDIEKVELVFKDGMGYDSKKLIASVKGQVGIH
jgi:imidazolonepropionase-like amidohydrolase/uncharacterized protein YndB with AHSA1/START domain